jgi:hypothetical protein
MFSRTGGIFRRCLHLFSSCTALRTLFPSKNSLETSSRSGQDLSGSWVAFLYLWNRFGQLKCRAITHSQEPLNSLNPFDPLEHRPSPDGPHPESRAPYRTFRICCQISFWTGLVLMHKGSSEVRGVSAERQSTHLHCLSNPFHTP